MDCGAARGRRIALGGQGAVIVSAPAAAVQRGFTLVEIMITVAVLSILLAIGPKKP